MSRSVRVLLLSSASIAVAALSAACGTQRISVPKSQPQLYRGAVLFSQRCSGCHTLSYAATHGSAANPRTATFISGPDFDVRCERPIDRVMYAIINGGFSGAYMPQNIVVGQDAIDVAKFVATYAGRQAPKIPGTAPCDSKPVGTLPPAFTSQSGTPLASVTSPRSVTAASAGAGRTSTAIASAPSRTRAGAAKKTAHS
jgi:mono/diheme cytochrome c family protein